MILIMTILFMTGSLTTPNQVVVYPDRAQVTRLAPVTCGSRTLLTFESVPPAAGADSFRARVSAGSIDGLRAELVTSEVEFAPKVERLRTALEALAEEGASLDDAIHRARDQREVALKFDRLTASFVSQEMVREKPDLKAWQSAFEVSLSTALAASAADADAHQKLIDLSRRRAETQRQLFELQVGSKKSAYRVEVLVSCPAGAAAEVALTYLVGGASWSPVYEARVGETAVDFSTSATVNQITGEDWSSVELTLSTAVPMQNATPPDLKKLFVQATEKPPERKMLVRRDEETLHGAVSADPQAPGPTGALAVNQGLSVQLRVPEKASVSGDGSAVRVFVGKRSLKARFELRAMPAVLPAAFRVADLTNELEWPLLPGPVELFRSTGLVGRYALERVAQGAAFTLTLGIEEAVRVKRIVVEELTAATGLFGGKNRFSYAYRFELANYGKVPVEVIVSDRLPVSELDDIAVTISEKTTPGYTLDKADGLPRWKIALKPQEQRYVDFAFRVDVPTTYDTGSL